MTVVVPTHVSSNAGAFEPSPGQMTDNVPTSSIGDIIIAICDTGIDNIQDKDDFEATFAGEAMTKLFSSEYSNLEGSGDNLSGTFQVFSHVVTGDEPDWTGSSDAVAVLYQESDYFGGCMSVSAWSGADAVSYVDSDVFQDVNEVWDDTIVVPITANAAARTAIIMHQAYGSSSTSPSIATPGGYTALNNSGLSSSGDDRQRTTHAYLQQATDFSETSVAANAQDGEDIYYISGIRVVLEFTTVEVEVTRASQPVLPEVRPRRVHIKDLPHFIHTDMVQ